MYSGFKVPGTDPKASGLSLFDFTPAANPYFMRTLKTCFKDLKVETHMVVSFAYYSKRYSYEQYSIPNIFYGPLLLCDILAQLGCKEGR